MRLSDHGYIIGSITDGQSNDLGIVVLDESNHLSLLAWRHSAADDCLTSLRNLQENSLVIGVIQNES